MCTVQAVDAARLPAPRRPRPPHHPAPRTPACRAIPQLVNQLQLRRSKYRTSIEEDEATMADPAAGPRPKVAARLLRGEKQILLAALAAAMALPGAADAAAAPAAPTAVKLE